MAPYEQKLRERVCLPGNQSCSQDLDVALGFATKNPKPLHKPVLFVLSCQKYDAPSGIRMNNEAYTAFPTEREILLQEGVGVWVLAVEKDVMIDNPHAAFAPFNGKALTIVHLCHGI